jgi:acyl-CoA synthetase (AMP-forming)/AMP-acid ligase II
MIKTSGYRVSPTEVEEALYSTKLVAEATAFGVAHPTLGQAIAVVVAAPPGGTVDVEHLLAECRKALPAYMVPTRIEVQAGALPRNPNGKIDRKALAAAYASRSAPVSA